MNRPRIFLASLLLALVQVVPSVAAAQDKIRFDPARDLAGFEAIAQSEYKDLYPVQAYSSRLGDELGPAELAQLQSEWQSECDKARVLVEQFRADPTRAFQWFLTNRLAKHSYFGKIGYVEDKSYPPWTILIQNPSKDDPAYAPAIAKRYGPWLQKVAEVFEARYVKPLELQRRPDWAGYSCAVLASSGDFQNYLRFARDPDMTANGAAFDSKLKLVVGFDDPFQTGESASSKGYVFMREAAQMMLTAHYTGPGTRVPSVLVTDGLSGYLAWPSGATPASIDPSTLRATRLEELATIAQDRVKRTLYLHTLEEFSLLRTYDEYFKLVQRKADAKENATPDWNTAWRVFFAESACWMHFLQHAKNEKYKPGFGKFVKLALSGLGGPDALRVSLSQPELGELDKEFWAWIFDEYARAKPAAQIDRTALDDLFAKDESADDATEVEPNAKAAAPVLPPFDPKVLSVDAADFEARHGQALVRARTGDLEGAKTALEGLLGEKPPSPEDGRIARDIARLQSGIALRAAFLEYLRAKNQRLAFEKDGKKFNVPVAKVEGGTITFGENKQGLKSWPIAELDPLEIAKQSEKKEAQGGVEPAARVFLFLLCGDARWEKLAKDDSAPMRELKEDALVWFKDCLKTGAVANDLDALAQSPAPKTRSECEAAIGVVGKITAAGTDLVLLVKKKPMLERFARETLAKLAEEVDPAEFVHGTLTRMGGGRVSIVYEFDREDEVSDFTRKPGFYAAWSKQFKPIPTSEAQSTFVFAKGVAAVHGQAMWHYALPFQSPLRVRYTFRYPLNNEVEAPSPVTVVFVCVEGEESLIASGEWGSLTVKDSKTGAFKNAKSPVGTFAWDQAYAVEIDHDGKKVTNSLDGKVLNTLSTGPRAKGDIFLYVSAESTLALERFEIEGKIDTAGLGDLRRAWVAAKMRELSL